MSPFRSCAQEPTSDLTGTWDAEWRLSVPPGEAPERYATKGIVILREDGTGRITVYGREDSVMASETAENDVRWSLEGDILHVMGGEEEEAGIRYTITERKKDFLHLVLVDDIVLELTRKK